MMSARYFVRLALVRLALAEDDDLEFEDWLDEVHGGGSEKVPNPNPDTKGQFPEVTYDTALKNDVFRNKAYQDYEKWRTGQKGESKSKPKAEEKPEKASLGLSSEQIEASIRTHRAAFDSFKESSRKKVAAYRKKPSRDVMDLKTFDALSEDEQDLFVNGHELGEYFEKNVLKDKATHAQVMKWWRASSGDTDAQELHGLLHSMGVEGSIPPDESSDKAISKARKKGPSNKKLKAYVHEVMAFTQAFFKHADIKELTVYRGVDGQGVEKTKKGDKVQVKCREASSFTIDPIMAEAFGHKVLAAKVPVDRILMSFLTYPDFGSPLAHRKSGGAVGESEMVILGGSGLQYEVRS